MPRVSRIANLPKVAVNAAALEKFHVVADGAKITLDAFADGKSNVGFAKSVPARAGVSPAVTGVNENLHGDSPSFIISGSRRREILRPACNAFKDSDVVITYYAVVVVPENKSVVPYARRGDGII